MFSLPELEDAHRVVLDTFPGTPQLAWPLLAERVGAEVWVKHENHTPTGAFKLRGGLVYADRLKRERPSVAGIVTSAKTNGSRPLVGSPGRT